MASKTKTVKPKHTKRAGESFVRLLRVDGRPDREIMGDRYLNNPNVPLQNRGYGLIVDELMIVPTYALAYGGDGYELIKSGRLEVVKDATEGVLPEIVDVSDDVAKTMFRDQQPPKPNRRQLIEHWRGILLEWSLAECYVDCLEAGCPPEETLQDLVDTYDRSFELRTARSQPWLKRSQELITIQRAKDAGLVPAQEVE